MSPYIVFSSSDVMYLNMLIFGLLQTSAQYEDKESSGSFNSSGNLLLSISTIASAIADASISSDPAQLAAMIMELSKKRRSKTLQSLAGDMDVSSVPTSNQNGLLEDLQKTTSLGDLSTPDMEKYLKRAEVSSSDSDGSPSHSCLDILTLADSLAGSHKATPQQSPCLENGAINPQEECLVREEQEVSKKCHVLTGNVSKQVEAAHGVLPTPRSDFKRSAIPRPKGSSLPTAASHPPKRSLGSGQSSIPASSSKLKPADSKSGFEKTKNDRSPLSTNKAVPESKIKIGTARPPISNATATSNWRSLKGDGSTSAPAFVPKSSPGIRGSGGSELSALKTSPNTVKNRTAGGHTDKPNINQARSPRSPRVAQSVSKEMAVDRQDSLPATQEKFGMSLFLNVILCCITYHMNCTLHFFFVLNFKTHPRATSLVLWRSVTAISDHPRRLLPTQVQARPPFLVHMGKNTEWSF